LNWLDWFIIGILVLSALQGLRRGLLAGIAGLAGLLGGLVVAFTYYRLLAQYLSGHWSIEERIRTLIDGVLKHWLPAGNNMPPAMLPDTTVSTGIYAADQFSFSGDYLSGIIVTAVLELLCFLALLLATARIINLACMVLTKIADIGFWGLFNRLGGLFFGAIRGVVLAALFLALVSFLQQPFLLPGGYPGSPGTFQLPGKTLQDSMLLPYFRSLLDAIGRPLPDFPPGAGHHNEPEKFKNI